MINSMSGFLIFWGFMVVMASASFGQTTVDVATNTYNLPWHKCEGEDSGAKIDCPREMPAPVFCGYWEGTGQPRKCLGGGQAELGTCVPTNQRYICIHKGFGWEEGDKLLGCFGVCERESGVACSYAPNTLSCHDDFWVPWPIPVGMSALEAR